MDVAGTITWDQLRELAGFRADKGCAVSLYLSLDPSEAPTAADVETRQNSLLSAAERLLDERKGSLSRDQREALKGDLERIARWFEDGFGRERGEVFQLRGGQLVEIADDTEEVPGQHDLGGQSQGRYVRHIDEIVERHRRRVADTLDGCVRKLRGARIVLVGGEDMRSDFEEILSNEVKSCLVGWTSAEAHADAPQLLEAAWPLLEKWWSKREEELLDRWREEAGKNGRATTGWAQTLEAASDARVELLLVQDGADEPAYQCPACGRAQMKNGSCPLDGTTLEPRDGALDLAVHQTLAHGGTVQVIRERRDLEPVGGVGALLRY